MKTEKKWRKRTYSTADSRYTRWPKSKPLTELSL